MIPAPDLEQSCKSLKFSAVLNDSSPTMDDERAKGILLEAGTNEVEFLRFSVSGTNCGINVSKVSQILTLDRSKLASPPIGAPSFQGMLYFRGKPIPIYDLALLMDMPKTPPKVELVLVTEFNQRTFGYIIDHVYGIHRCFWGQFCPIDEIFHASSECALGTVTVENNIVLILDFEAMMGRVDPSMSIDRYGPEAAPTDLHERRKHAKILFCEDSTVIQRLLLKTLRDAGYEQVQTFPSGVEGFRFIQENPSPEVNVIISDIEMPGMDGLKLCREVHGIKGWKDIPFIIFSSMVNDQMRQKCEAVGADAAFAKPEAAKIVAELDKWCL